MRSPPLRLDSQRSIQRYVALPCDPGLFWAFTYFSAMKHGARTLSVISVVSTLALVACQTPPPAASIQTPAPLAASATPAPVASEIEFVDLKTFDNQLSGALAARLPQVEVDFYNRVTPTELPERLQHWMASVQTGGGSVRVVPPPGSITPKDPLLLFSALWNAIKLARMAAETAQRKPAQAYDAQILLKADPQGEAVVDKIVFVQREK